MRTLHHGRWDALRWNADAPPRPMGCAQVECGRATTADGMRSSGMRTRHHGRWDALRRNADAPPRPTGCAQTKCGRATTADGMHSGGMHSSLDLQLFPRSSTMRDMPMTVDEKAALLERIHDCLMQASGLTMVLTLDDIGEAVGDAALTYDDIEKVIVRLEAAGRLIAEDKIDLSAGLREVLGAARRHREQFQRAPTVSELVEATALPRQTVLAALRFAQTFR